MEELGTFYRLVDGSGFAWKNFCPMNVGDRGPLIFVEFDEPRAFFGVEISIQLEELTNEPYSFGSYQDSALVNFIEKHVRAFLFVCLIFVSKNEFPVKTVSTQVVNFEGVSLPYHTKPHHLILFGAVFW